MAEPRVCAPIDANGNLTADDTKTYSWNAVNQLVEVKAGSATIATFAYDGDGRRTQKVAAGLTHIYVYDAEDIIEERITGTSSDTIRYYHGAGIDEPLARKNSGGTVTCYLADHLGSIVQETSSSGSVSLDREYDPWGVPLQGGTAGGYAFAGRDWDTETDLYANRARYYSPVAGRWLGEDPIGLAGGANLSMYVSGNLTRLVDPFGLCAEDGQSPEQKRQPNPFDERWKRMATKNNAPSKLNEARPDIERRAKAMGQPDTYAQLALVVGVSSLLASEAAEISIGDAALKATVLAEMWREGMFDRASDAFQGATPVPPGPTPIQYTVSLLGQIIDRVFK